MSFYKNEDDDDMSDLPSLPPSVSDYEFEDSDYRNVPTAIVCSSKIDLPSSTPLLSPISTASSFEENLEHLLENVSTEVVGIISEDTDDVHEETGKCCRLPFEGYWITLPSVEMAQIVGHKRRGASSGETSASSSSTCQLPALPGGPSPGTLTDELAALFECPVCFEIVLPPIMQCQVGHLVCASCRPKLSCCPTCRGTLGNIRNLAMEKVANNLMFPCKHKSTGCRMSLGLNEKAEHEEICEFRPYSCPCPGASCSWQGQLDKVMVHLQHSHKNITTLNGEDIVFLATEINLAGAVDWVMMQSCFGHHFMLVLEKQEKNDGHTQFFAIVQLIGSRKQAEHFAYRLELNGNRRRLIWEAMPRSSHEGVASAIMASDCLAFDNSIAQHFADNGNLGINVTISLVC